MKTLVSFVLCVLAASAGAQTPVPQPASDVPPAAAKDNPSTRDARACLEFPTREQVIACAEKYRPRRPAAKT